uniref:Phytanoyl-CoA dioxygenase n=1 Tax=Alexandrium catenella TaxID=2925 RepID=A0A7S1RF61_ALECA
MPASRGGSPKSRQDKGRGGIKAGALPLFSAQEVAAFTLPLGEAGARLRQVLEEHGCAIVTGVAGEEDCRRLEGHFAQDLGGLIDKAAVERSGSSAVKRDAEAALQDPRTLSLETSKLLGDMERCQLRGLPHGSFAWACRLLPSVRRCYEAIHDTADLVSSCDNPFFAPAEHEEAFENRSWPHVDHNSNDRRLYDDLGQAVGDWEVYQGLLYVWGSESSRASTTVVLPGSHRTAYPAIMADPSAVERGRKGAHCTRLSVLANTQLASALQDSWLRGAGRVPVPRGGLFLWSSRTLHQGWSGGPRLAQPVCWEPAGRRDDATLDRKMRLAALGLPSTHWASLGIPHTLVAPRPCSATAPCEQGKVALPLRASIQPASLRPGGRSVGELWEALQDGLWEAHMPAALRESVAESICPEILAAL